jgi:hypothetical protein
MRTDVFSHTFVEQIPAALEPGVLYVSIRYRTVVHLCACGCGNKVVTPIRPPRWHLKFDGDAISLWPSVGSWQFPCRSHYWINTNTVVWSASWTDAEVAVGRERDAADMTLYLASRAGGATAPEPPGTPARSSWRQRLRSWLRFAR